MAAVFKILHVKPLYLTTNIPLRLGKALLVIFALVRIVEPCNKLVSFSKSVTKAKTQTQFKPVF